MIARCKASSQGLIRQSACGTVEEPSHRQEHEVPQPPSALPVLVKADQSRGTEAEMQKPDVEFTPAAMRRIATKTDTKRPSDPNLCAGKNKRGAVGQWLDDFWPQPSPSPPLSEQGASAGHRAPPPVHQSTLKPLVNLERLEPFVNYQPIQARSSSTTWGGDTINAHHMRTYIGSS